MLESRVRAIRLRSRLGPGLETPGIRNALVRKGQGSKCLKGTSITAIVTVTVTVT